MKVLVTHGEYGCDTGCCGHWITLVSDDGVEMGGKFDFSHAYGASEEEKIEYAIDLIKEKFGEDHCKDLDKKNSIILYNC